MTRKLGMAFVGSVMAGALSLGASTTSWGTEQQQPEDAAPVVQRMETHWQTLIRERDPARRAALIAEHRRIMAEARTVVGTPPAGQMGGRHQYNVQHTIEMHSMMLDLME